MQCKRFGPHRCKSKWIATCDRRSAAPAATKLASERSAGERLDPAGGANEARHDEEPDHKENRLQHVAAGFAEMEQAGERPAAREGRSEHLGADQDGRAQHSEHVHPDDPRAATRAKPWAPWRRLSRPSIRT